MTPSNVKKLVYRAVVNLKLKKEWNVGDVSGYKEDNDKGALSISFMHKSVDDKTKNPYFTVHSNYLGVWFGTFNIHGNVVMIKSVKLVISPDKVKELSKVEKQINIENLNIKNEENSLDENRILLESSSS